jgi:cell division protein FtsB
MDNEIYYVKSLQLESELELAHAKIRELRKEIQELKTKVSLLEK